jgi:16S rRNA processing protein RimM
VTGEVRLKLFAASVDSLGRHAQLQVGDRLLTLKSIRPGATAIARFAEISSRDAAEALRGQLVTVPRSALPPLADGEYYHADLIGLACRSAEGAPLGVIVAVENFGAGDLIEVERADGRRALVPFRPGVADLAGDEVVVDPAFLA